MLNELLPFGLVNEISVRAVTDLVFADGAVTLAVSLRLLALKALQETLEDFTLLSGTEQSIGASGH